MEEGRTKTGPVPASSSRAAAVASRLIPLRTLLASSPGRVCRRDGGGMLYQANRAQILHPSLTTAETGGVLGKRDRTCLTDTLPRYRYRMPRYRRWRDSTLGRGESGGEGKVRRTTAGRGPAPCPPHPFGARERRRGGTVLTCLYRRLRRKAGGRLLLMKLGWACRKKGGWLKMSCVCVFV